MPLWGKNNKLYGKLLMSRKTYDAVLENNSWADIQEALRNGNPAGWKVGDTKTVSIGVGNDGSASNWNARAMSTYIAPVFVL